MKILIISQYFWPENFRINDVCLALKERGHYVSVLAGKPNYPHGKYFEGYSWWKKNKEVWEGVTIYRSNLILRGSGGGVRLFLNYFSFSLLASLKVLGIREDFDKIFIFAPSPITVGIPGMVARKRFKARSYLWIQDLWPESIKIAGGINNKFILGLLSKMTKWIYAHTDKLLVQSKGFIPYLQNQKVKVEKVIYYPFYAESFYTVQEKHPQYMSTFPKNFKLVFAGNLGESQSFNTLLKAASILKNKSLEVKWLIYGDGRMKEEIVHKVHELGLEDTFFLKGSLPASEMPKVFSCADGLIVSLKKSEIFSVTVPSKLQSYLACGKPIIGSLDGIGGQIIKDANAGYVADAEDPEGLAAAIEKLYNQSEKERKAIGINGRTYYEKEFEREVLLSKLEEIFLNE